MAPDEDVDLPDWEVEADRLAAVALAAGRPTEWFDQIYAAAAAGAVSRPWSRVTAQVQLAEWSAGRSGDGRRAVVVGCGLGADAEYLAQRGFRTTGFDVSPTAIAMAKERFPHTAVQYQPADLFDLPADWRGAFDLVVEIFTVQALPLSLRAAACAAVAGLVAPGGTLLVIQMDREKPADAAFLAGPPPWPLSREELDLFGRGLELVNLENLAAGAGSYPRRWRAEFVRRA